VISCQARNSPIVESGDFVPGTKVPGREVSGQAVDRWSYWTVTHEDHVLCNPLSTAALDEALDAARVPEGGAVLDIACGKAELLVRLAERGRIRGVGVVLAPAFVRAARERVRARVPSADLRIVEDDGARFQADPASFDLVACLGASWIFGGHRGTLRSLSRWTRPGGCVLVAQPFWRREPDPAYLAATGLARTELATHEDDVAAGRESGLEPVLAREATLAEWDEYEGLQWRAAQRHAAANPADADARAILARARASWDAYVRWGRDTLGDGLYLFRKP